MEAKMETLKPCSCGGSPVVAKIKPGWYVCACKSCGTSCYGSTQTGVCKNWNAGVRR